ncbi:MAG: 30S ribosomal protein S12 methylthiotransferase RimO [Planctomycetota bacterium]
MNPIRVHLVSLGCPKNLVDSEVFLGRICSEGFQITPEPEAADVLMVNTCGFIDAAKEESVNTILELCGYKEEDPRKRVVVTGCLGQRYPDELVTEIPEIDAVIGLAEYGKMGSILTELVAAAAEEHPEPQATRVDVSEPNHPAYSEGSRLRLTPVHSSYLRTSEGCDNPCTFCSIPSFRGKFRSKPLDMLVAEAEELAASGVTELNLISQDLTSYGIDGAGRSGVGDYLLPELLAALNDVDGVRWIRLLYAYPYRFTNDMIDAVREVEKVVPYIDMPIQHINDRMLKRMGRRMGQEGTVDLFQRMRDRIPGLVLRTTFIVGFPGETDEEFQQLIDFVRQFRLERVGAFTYSDEDGTPATKLKDKVPTDVAEARREALMLAQQEIVFDWNQSRVGTDEVVLIDGFEEGEGAVADGSAEPRVRLYGRSYAEAPEIDSRIYLPHGCGAPGEYVNVRITDTENYDLIAEPARVRSSL